MSKINFEDIQEKYKTALTEKEANAQDVVSAIVDNELKDKFNLIQKDKEQISSLEDLYKYQKRIKSFFDEVYKIITAPGVQRFIDWLDELNSKVLETKTRKYITEFLIQEYATYENTIKNIIDNKDVVKSNNSLFEGIKKSVKDNINKRIDSDFTSNDKVKEEFPDFIEDLNDLLEGLSEIEELNFVDVKDFYTNNIEEKGNDDYSPDIDKVADFYYDLVKQVVEKKDFLTTNQDIISLSTIVENVQNLIDDINSSIETIKTIDISSESNEDILTLYNKFEKSINFKTGQNDISDFIQESINDTWEKTINAYNVCQQFYINTPQAKISKLKENKNKWSSFTFANKIEQYVLTLSNITSDNPIKSIKTNDISKIKSSYTKVEKSINSLEENNPKDDIINYFSNITSDFENKKIEILNKLRIEESKIDKLKRAVNEIKNFIENIKNASNLLDSFNDDFIDGIIESYNYINDEYRSAIENSDIKDDLDFLDKINEEGYVLNKEELEKKIEVLKRLLEYDLININLTKNI